MELLRGPAAHVSTNNRVTGSGTANSVSISTTFITTFSIGDRQVRITASDPAVVNLGDYMVVSGEEDRSGVLEGICYVNVTRGAQYTESNPLFWKIGAVIAFLMAAFLACLDLLLVGISVLEAKLGSDMAQTIAILTTTALALYFAGRWLMRRGQKLSRAVRMIQDASTRRA
jgi:hypothetical protein